MRDPAPSFAVLTKEERILAVMDIAGVDREKAEAALVAEQWFLHEAVASLAAKETK